MMFHRIILALAICTLSVACSRSEDREQVHNVEAQVAIGTIYAKASDGVEIAATVHSKGQPNVVLVHGWMCDQAYWEEQIPALAGHFGVVTVDLAGFEADFAGTCGGFVRSMFGDQASMPINGLLM